MTVWIVLLSISLLFAGCIKHPDTASPGRIASSSLSPASTTTAQKPDEPGEAEVDLEVDEISESTAEVVLVKPLSDKPKRLERVMKRPEISLDELIERLKNTEAIGLLTKLAIRSDVLDFKSSIDEHRKKGELERYIGHLRDHFDGLLLKILALLERDPTLSKDIHHARESIWRSFLEAKS